MSSRRHPAVLAWTLWGLWAGTTATGTWLVIQGPASADYSGFGAAAAGFATVGALVASRRPDNPLGWLLLLFALASGVQTFAVAYAWTGETAGHLAAAWLGGWVWWICLAVVGGFIPLLFPDGHLLSPRWRPVFVIAATATAVSIVGTAFAPGTLQQSEPIPNPLGAHGFAGELMDAGERVGPAAFVLAVVLSAVSVVVRHRRSRGVEHQQVKWFAFAGVLGLTGLTMGALVEVLPFKALDSWAFGGIGWWLFTLATLAGMPIAIAVAILRHRLFDIDVVINRTLVYAALTAILLATYVVSVLVLGRVLTPLTGDSNLAVAASTLAVATLFRPARRRIQDTVDRRFYRHRYDAARTLDDFTTRLRHELDLDAVGTDLRAVTQDVLQPTHVSLWIRP